MRKKKKISYKKREMCIAVTVQCNTQCNGIKEAIKIKALKMKPN